jgi:ATP-dependent DNA ligase
VQNLPPAYFALVMATGIISIAAEGFAKACELGLEGIVSKREGSFYQSGRSQNWLETKNPNFVRT